MHLSPFFWVAAFFILLAMIIFVVTDGFLIRPRATQVQAATPAVGP